VWDVLKRNIPRIKPLIQQVITDYDKE